MRNFLTIYSDHNPNHIDIKIIFSREIDLLFLKLRCDNLTPNLACVLSRIGVDKTKVYEKNASETEVCLLYTWYSIDDSNNVIGFFVCF